MQITEGTQAPDFSLAGSDGKQHRLSDYRGKYVAVYFYPKDDTPGCTIEACGFRDAAPAAADANLVVLGVSPDPLSDHNAFIDKYQLPFVLLSDPDKSLMSAWGAYGEKVLYGKTSLGVIRSTVLVAPDGTVVKHWKKVPKAEEHPDAVLKAVREHSQANG